MTGRYCAECGEAAVHRNYSLKHAAGELFESLTQLDGRVPSTFRSLIARPGELVSHFLAGRRKPQMGPVQLFLVCNVLYFLIQPLTAFSTFTSTLGIQTTARPWSAFASELVAARLRERGVALETYALAFNATAHFQGKSLVILMVPLFALGAHALYGRSRRFYAEHLVFALYVFAFTMLWMAVSTLLLTKPVLMANASGWPDATIEAVFTTLIAVPFAWHVFAAARRTYGESVVRTALKTIALVFWTYAVLTIYRFVLFFTTFFAT